MEQQIKEQEISGVDNNNINSIIDNQNNNQEMKTLLPLDKYEQEKEELRMQLDIELIKRYLEFGKQAEKKAKKKDGIILMGPTGVGKSTTLHYLMGIEMFEEVKTLSKLIDNKNEEIQKQVISPHRKIEGINIGYESVSETQFLNIVDLEEEENLDCILIDSPGFKDKRKLEIDISNNLNTIKVLKVCKSVRFILLFNYHDLKADRQGPFLESAKIAAQILNGEDFEKNIKSLSVFYTHSNQTAISEIQTLITDLISNLSKLEMIDDRDLLEKFLKYLLSQIKEKQSFILNPLDSEIRQSVLEIVFQKPKLTEPSKHLKNFSFQQDSENKIKFFCLSVKGKVEEYASQLKFKEISFFLKQLNTLFTLTRDQFIKEFYEQLKEKVEKGFKLKIDEQINNIIVTLKRGNQILEDQLNQLMILKQSLTDWTNEKSTNFKGSIIDMNYFNNQFLQKLKSLLQELNNLEDFIQMYSGVLLLKDQLSNFEEIEIILKEKINNIILQNFQRGAERFDQIKQSIESQQNWDADNLVEEILQILNQSKEQQELLKKYNIINQIQLTDQLTVKFTEFLDYFKNIKQFIQDLNAAFDLKQIQLDNIEKQLQGFKQKTEELTPYYQLLVIFASNSSLCSYSPEIIIVKEDIDRVVKSIKSSYFDYFTIRIDKLNSKYLREDFIEFFTLFNQRFNATDEEISVLKIKYFSQIEGIIKSYSKKTKLLFDELKIMNTDHQIDPSDKIDKTYQTKNPLDKLQKRLETIKSIQWIDTYFGNTKMKFNLESFLENLEKYSKKIFRSIQPLLSLQESKMNLKKRRDQWKQLSMNYFFFIKLQDNFEQTLPSLKQMRENILNTFEQFFKSLVSEIESTIGSIKDSECCSLHQLLEIEKILICLDNLPKEIQGKSQYSINLIERYNQHFQKLQDTLPTNNQDLLSYTKEDFKKWNLLLCEIQTILKNEESLIIFLNTFPSVKNLNKDVIVIKIQKFHDLIKKKLNGLSIEEYKQTKIYCDLGNEMSNALDQQISLEYLILSPTLQQEINAIKGDIQNLDNFQRNTEKILRLKDIPERQNDYDQIIKYLSQMYQKQLKGLLKYIKQFDINGSPKSEIEAFFENISKFDELLEEKFLAETVQSTFQEHLNSWANTDLSEQFTKYENSQDQMRDFLIWYLSVQTCLKNHAVDIQQLPNFDKILGENYRKQIQQYIEEIPKNQDSHTINLFSDLVQKFKRHINLLSAFQQERLVLQGLFDNMKEFIDEQYKDCQQLFKEHYSALPVNMNELRQIISYLHNLQIVYNKGFDNSDKDSMINEMNQQVKQKEQEQVCKFQRYLKEKQSRNLVQYMEDLQIFDQDGFLKNVEIMTDQNIKNNKILELFFEQKKNNFSDIDSSLYFILNLKKLKNYQNEINVPYFETDELILKLLQIYQSFLTEFEQLLTNSHIIDDKNIFNFFKMKEQLQIIEEFYQITLNEFSLLQKNYAKLNDDLYLFVRDTINNFKISLEISDFIELNKLLKQLEKIDRIIVLIKEKDETLKKNNISFEKYNEDQILQNSLQNNINCDSQLFYLVVNSGFQNYEQYKENLNKLIKNVELNLGKYYKKKQFQQFVQSFINLKEFYQFETKNEPKKNYFYKIYQEYKNNIKNDSEYILNSIAKEEWKGEFSDKVDLFYEKVKQLNTTDLRKILLKKQSKIQDFLQNKLIYKTNIFKNKNLDGKKYILLDLREICQLVPSFEQQVKNKIADCLNFLLSQDDKQFFDLSQLLLQEKNYLSELIMRENKQFQDYFAKMFEEKTKGQHNPSYINQKLQILNLQTKEKTGLPIDEQLNLTNKYEDYNKQLQEVVKKYQFEQNCQGLIEDILQFVNDNQILQTNLDQWNEECHNLINTLFSKVSAYWTLLNLQECILKKKKNMVLRKLHASQVFSIMILLGFDNPEKNLKLNNQFIQILTGEGKSIILGVLSILLALIGYKVDVVCYSQHLSNRDYLDFKKLFEDLNVIQKIKYDTFTDICDDKINSCGDVRLLSKQLLNGGLNIQSQQNKEKAILLIDEADVFFSDSFYGQTYNPSCIFECPEVKTIFQNIWKNRSQCQNLHISKISQSAEFKTLCQRFPNMKSLFEFHFKLMIKSASTMDSHNYTFNEGKVEYEINDSISTNIYKGYYTNYAYYKELTLRKYNEKEIQQYCGINLKCGYFSYSQLPFEYDKILGVTGTLDCIDNFHLDIIKEYVQKATIIPSMFGESNLESDNNSLFYLTFDKDNFFLTIANKAQEYLDKGQPVLIFFKDNNILNKFNNSSSIKSLEKKQKALILNQQQKHIKTIIESACRIGQLTLCERSFGRGTDFCCYNEEINNKGGVVVIQAFYSEDISEDIQVKGRTARQQNKGIYIQIILSNDLEESFSINQQEIQQFINKKSTLPDFLTKQRDILSNKTKLNINQTLKNAESLHQKTVQFTKFLKEEKKKEAIDQLLEFNQGRSNSFFSQSIHFLFLLDESGSMQEKDDSTKTRWERLIDAIESFARERSIFYQDLDVISIVYYNSSSRIITQYQNISKLKNILQENPPKQGGTIFYNAINEAFKILEGEPPEIKYCKKVIMFLSDGQDHPNYKIDLTQILNQLKAKYKKDILGFWTFSFGQQSDSGILQEMADIMIQCGGQFKSSINYKDLQQNFLDLANLDEIVIMK